MHDTSTKDSRTLPDLDDLPPGVLHEIMQAAIARGLIPPPDGYTPDGQPVWQLEKMAEHLGHTLAEARELLREYSRAHPLDGCVDPASIRRTH
jgi:hypothetical protein